MQTMERVIQVPNETEAQIARTTKEGKKITYKLKVLQQPERARACGSGAKSSADRRPVDPPPIVELRIYEGEKADKDITFQLSANYFLFATLEQARHIAQGRVSQDANRLTVLTGTPVAGLVYLDRPTPAGYFIFPDLSVRHEGKYRLSFNLYEELKEDKDGDQTEDDDSAKAPGLGGAHVTHRLEVRSQPFTVYSAKKFPGLASSTVLSRTVAEQGCRVRIRRDVRMRKRDKTGKEWDEYEDDTAYDRARQAATPDIYGHPSMGNQGMLEPVQRSRSESLSSHVSLAPATLSRRPSAQEMAQLYQGGYAAQSVAAPAGPSQYNQSPYGPSMAHQYQQPAFTGQTSLQSTMPPPQSQMSAYNYTQQGAVSSQQPFYGYGATAPHAYDSPQHTRTSSIDYGTSMSQDHRRSSTASYTYMTPQQSATAQSSIYNGANGFTNHTAAPTPAQNGVSSALPPSMTSHLPPLNTSVQEVKDKALEASSPTSPSTLPTYYEMHKSGASIDMGRQNQTSGAKRAYANVFSTQHMSGPLRAGARPGDYDPFGHSSIMRADVDDGGDDAADLQALRMSYRRADGREIARPLPPSH